MDQIIDNPEHTKSRNGRKLQELQEFGAFFLVRSILELYITVITIIHMSSSFFELDVDCIFAGLIGCAY